jgi:hypothetical protein
MESLCLRWYLKAYACAHANFQTADRPQQGSLNILKMLFTTSGFCMTRQRHHLRHSVSIIERGHIYGTSISLLRIATLCCTIVGTDIEPLHMGNRKMKYKSNHKRSTLITIHMIVFHQMKD